MATSYSPNSATDGLVFYYDTFNTLKSYKGEPTTNLATLDFSNTSVWFNEQASTTTKELQSETLFGYPVYRIQSKPGSIWITPVAFNGYDKANGPITLSAYIRNVGTAASVSTYLSGDYSTDSLGNSNYKNIPTDGVWRRYSWTRTAADMNTANQLEFRTSGTNIQISCPQVEHKLHPTPIVEGTRSATQGLVDLTGNSSIDLSNVSFDQDSVSNMIFDGTNDYVDLGPGLTNLDTSILSIELVFRSTSGTSGNNIILGWHEGETPHGYITTGNFTGHWGNESISFYNEGTGTTPLSFAYTNGHAFYNDSKYHHVVFILQTGGYSIYVDGEEKPVNSSFRNGSMSTVMPSDLFGYGTTPSVVVGAGSNPPNYAEIRVPVVRIYDKALTASEVKSNFNAIKSRYGI